MYTLFYHIISICLLLQLSFTTCFIAGKANVINPDWAANGNKQSIISGNDSVVLHSSIKPGRSNNALLKKNYIDFFIGHKHIFIPRALKKHGTILRSHKRQKVAKKHESTSIVTGNNRGTVAQIDNKCKFPFIHDGVSRYHCLKASGNNNKTWCSLTSNYDRDTQWRFCSSPVINAKRRDDLRHKYNLTLSLSNWQKRWENILKPNVPCIVCDEVLKNATDSDVYTARSEINDLNNNNDNNTQLHNNNTLLQNSSITNSSEDDKTKSRSSEQLSFFMGEDNKPDSVLTEHSAGEPPTLVIRLSDTGSIDPQKKGITLYSDNDNKVYDDVSTETDSEIRVQNASVSGNIVNQGKKNNLDTDTNNASIADNVVGATSSLNQKMFKNETGIISGDKELNDDEKKMIAIVGDSVLKDGKEKADNNSFLEDDENQWKSDVIGNATGNSSQLQIPGTKNINIIIINNKDTNFNLDDIEPSISRSNEPTKSQPDNKPINNTNESNQGNVSASTNTSAKKETYNSIYGTGNIDTIDNMGRKNETAPHNLTDYIAPIIRPVVNTTNLTVLTTKKNASKAPSGISDVMREMGTALIHLHNADDISGNVTSGHGSNLSLPVMKKVNVANTTDGVQLIRHLTPAEIERKFNESKKYLEAINKKGITDTSPNLLLDNDKKDLEEKASLQSLRMSGLVSMNYAPEEIIIPTYGGNANGENCMFPFIYDGETYFNCIKYNDDKSWCSVTESYDKTPRWGFCSEEQLNIENEDKGNLTVSERREKKLRAIADLVHNEGEEVISLHSAMKTFGGNANGKRCAFPFVYDGQTYMKCIPKKEGMSWCAVRHSYDLHPEWGFCCDNDIYKC